MGVVSRDPGFQGPPFGCRMVLTRAARSSRSGSTSFAHRARGSPDHQRWGAGAGLRGSVAIRQAAQGEFRGVAAQVAAVEIHRCQVRARPRLSWELS